MKVVLDRWAMAYLVLFAFGLAYAIVSTIMVGFSLMFFGMMVIPGALFISTLIRNRPRPP